MDKQQELRYLKFILQTEQGRRYLYSLIDFYGFYRPSMTGNSQTFYNEGMRNVALKLYGDIGEADPEAFLKMQYETRLLRNKEGK